MGFGFTSKHHALLLLLLLVGSFCLQSKAIQAHEEGGSVVFMEGTKGRFFRDHAKDTVVEPSSMMLPEVSAAVSVLLGFAPSDSLTAESSSKLNSFLSPNPFDRPHAVLKVEVSGIEAPSSLDFRAGSASSYKVQDLKQAEIELPGEEDEISIVSIDEPFDHTNSLDKEFTDLALFLGGTYTGSVESQDAKLTFALPSGTSFILQLSEQPDMEYALGLASLIHGIKKAIVMHEDFSGSSRSHAEFITGAFTGIEALQDYGPEVAQKGMDLFQAALDKAFTLLLKQYGGKIAGVVLFDKKPSVESHSILYPTFTARAARILVESKLNATSREVLLVRRSLAWITGIILILATIIGVYLLLNMPLTRDTLLYANVKLD